jgi:outer membrane autotransporter protein
VGYIDYNSDWGDDEDGTFRVLGQVEYDFSKLVTGNLGVDYYNDDDDNLTYIVAGLEFYPTKNVTLWVDYNYNIDDDYEDDDYVGIGVEFKFN